MKAARLTVSPTSLIGCTMRESAPFLYSVSPMADHLLLESFGRNSDVATESRAPKSPRDAFLQVTYPLSRDELLKNSVTDFSNWSSFRLGKFYEVVDALTADVSYRHCGDIHGVDTTLVTAGHYHSRKLQRTSLEEDLVVRSYVTSVGTSSMEVRTDAIQQVDGEETLLNVCHTVMVALDKDSGRSFGKAGRSIPDLLLETEDAHDRLELADQHNKIRRKRAEEIMQLRSPISHPPTQEEFEELHKLHQDQRAALDCGDKASLPLRVEDYTFRSSTIIFPESRNVHGKLFGGFVMEESEKLAQYTARFFAGGRHVVPLGIDEALFHQPIAIGDCVTFTARLIQSTGFACRVLVVVETRDPTDPSRVPLRSDRLMFVYGGSDLPQVIPETYSEILMHVDARRRQTVEGPSQEYVESILAEMKND